jgi:hypothetical protein
MGNSGSRLHPRHTSVVHTMINIHHRGRLVPTLVLHSHRFHRLVFLFLLHRIITFTAISSTSNKGTILHSPSRRLAMVRARREYHTTFVLPHARGQLRLPHK